MDELEAVGQYLPRLLLDSPTADARWWNRDGTLLFSDVSGFTALSEKLARHGKAGAEEMVGAISQVFTPLLGEIAGHGGDVLKFGGDALLSFFDGAEHALRAASCAHRLRRVLRSQGRVKTAFGEVPLGMSQGLHSGEFAFFVCGARYADLIVTGPAVTATLQMESAAERGEVLMTAATAAQLPPRTTGNGHDAGQLLLSAPPFSVPGPPIHRPQALKSHQRFVPLALRDRLADVVDDSEHRHVTVGFLQFLGCDDALDGDGPDGLHQRLCRIVDAVTEVAEEHDITIICIDVGLDGGKFMLACGAPDAQEHDAELMLRFGTELLRQGLPLPMRLGVNHGAVFGGRVGAPFRWTYSTMGDPVNLAARVMGKAERGTVLATRAVLERAGGHVRSEAVPAFAVKGKTQLVEASLVHGVGARLEHVAAAAIAPLIGRDQELSRLTDAWRRVEKGQRQSVEIVGEAGTGKSRLATELLSRTSADVVIRAAGERYHRGSAYFAAHLALRAATGISVDAHPEDAGAQLTDWVERQAPDLVEWLPLLALASRARVPSTAAVEAIAPEFRPARLRAVVTDLLRVALPRTAVFFLEDAFWFDSASVQLFVDVIRDASDMRWLFLITRRDEPTGLHAGLGYDANEIRLHALTEDEAAQLARAVAPAALAAAEAHQLAQAGRGNPFFVLQIAQAWQPGDDVLPLDVQSTVAARLDRLPVASRRLLGRAAVLGTFIDLPLLTATVGGALDASALEPLVGEFLVVDGPERLRFAHDLFRTVAYDSLPFKRRRELHARAAEAIETEGDVEARAALLSLHFETAGDLARAWHYARLAAERARINYATTEAADLYARALRTGRGLPDVPSAEVAAVAEALGDVLEICGRYDAAVDAFVAARRHQPAAADEVRLLRKLGMVRERESRYRAALTWYTRGLKHAEALDGHEALAATASLLVHRAAVRYRQGRFEDAVTAARAAATAARRAGRDDDLAHAYFLLDAALTDLQDPRAIQYRDLALPIYEALDDLVGQANVHNNVGIDAYYEGRLEDALASYQRSLDCRRRVGDVVGAATAENNIGEVLSDLGRFDEALPMFEEAAAVWDRAGFRAGYARALINLAKLHMRTGNAERGVSFLDRAEQVAGDVGAGMFHFEARACRAELLLSLGSVSAAAELAGELLAEATTARPSSVVLASLHYAHGMALRAMGDELRGSAEVRQALSEFENLHLSWDADRTWAALRQPVVLPDSMPRQRTRQASAKT